MKVKLKELRNQRGILVKDARALLDLAETEKRELTGEELTKYNAMIAKQTAIGETIVREEKQAEIERELAETAAEEGRTTGDDEAKGPRASKEYRSAFRKYLLGGTAVLSGEDVRALEATAQPSGGYLVAPEEFVASLIKFVDDQVFIRGMATVFQVPNAQKLGIPSLDTDPADADWTTELATGSEDSSMAFGKRELAPNPVAKLIKVSKKLLRASLMPADTMVMQRLAYKFAITQEKGFLTGTGASQPLGVFTASANGIPTSRDVSTGNATTSIAFDGLISAKYSLKGNYWPKAQWIFHRDAIAQIAKLKDGEGQYIWQQSKTENDPDRLLGRPLNMSEYAPNTFTTGLYVGIFGDFSQYYIADALDMTVQRVTELFALTNQDGFIGRMESDGMPVLAEAFARVKLA